MASVIITLKIMQESPDVHLAELQKHAEEAVKKHNARVMKVEIQPVAFGLKAILLTFARDEALGDTEPIEQDVAKLKGVASVQVTHASRALG